MTKVELPSFIDEESESKALGYGIWRGFRSITVKSDYPSKFKKPQFFFFGYILGHLLKVAVIITIGSQYLI